MADKDTYSAKEAREEYYRMIAKDAEAILKEIHKMIEACIMNLRSKKMNFSNESFDDLATENFQEELEDKKHPMSIVIAKLKEEGYFIQFDAQVKSIIIDWFQNEPKS